MIVVTRKELRGEIFIPPSKSQTLRGVLFGALAEGKTTIHHPLISPDTEKMVEACRLFGAIIDLSPEKIEIQGLGGVISRTEDVIDSGNSGIVLRFCSAIGALASFPVVVTGDASIRHRRPMGPLLGALSDLGVKVSSMRGDQFAPVIIEGPMKGGRAKLRGEDSQHVSALLIAASLAQSSTIIEVENPGETPWVDLTLSWFDRLKIGYEREGFERFFLKGNSRFDGFTYAVPGDLSSASFPIAAALITNSELTLKNVDLKDPQGDKRLLDVFEKMGACFEIDESKKTLKVKRGGSLRGVEVDINPMIDALPILAVVACFAKGETKIFGGEIARTKESDRIESMKRELQKMGASIEETLDGLIIGGSKLKGADVESYEDHRVCMSLYVAGLGAEGRTTIRSIECVKKTFPTFFQAFKSIGG